MNSRIDVWFANTEDAPKALAAIEALKVTDEIRMDTEGRIATMFTESAVMPLRLEQRKQIVNILQRYDVEFCN